MKYVVGAVLLFWAYQFVRLIIRDKGDGVRTRDDVPRGDYREFD